VYHSLEGTGSIRNTGMPQSEEADFASFMKFAVAKNNPGLPFFSTCMAW
jgi:hypothetical protein